jgi:2-isopropylmalate synthase
MPTKENRASWAMAMIKAGIPHIEIGFPVIDGDQETIAVRHVVEETSKLAGGIFVLARLSEGDIEQCKRVLDGAKHGGIHTFIGTSPEHRESLSMTQEQILENIGPRIRQIRDAGYMAQFSAEDATRTEDDFLRHVYAEAVSA